jgi:hypothetical protein
MRKQRFLAVKRNPQWSEQEVEIEGAVLYNSGLDERQMFGDNAYQDYFTLGIRYRHQSFSAGSLNPKRQALLTAAGSTH